MAYAEAIATSKINLDKIKSYIIAVNRDMGANLFFQKNVWSRWVFPHVEVLMETKAGQLLVVLKGSSRSNAGSEDDADTSDTSTLVELTAIAEVQRTKQLCLFDHQICKGLHLVTKTLPKWQASRLKALMFRARSLKCRLTSSLQQKARRLLWDN